MATKQEDEKLVFKTDFHVMQVLNIVLSIYEWPFKTGFTVPTCDLLII